MKSILCGVLAVAAVFGGCAQAESLKLTGNKHWLIYSSTKDLDIAIGEARSLGQGAQVVLSDNGFYGIVKGPYMANTIAMVKKLDDSVYEVPKDALLSNGAHYVKSVWREPVNSISMTGYELNKPLQLSAGDVSVEVKLEKAKDDTFVTIVSGNDKSGHSFTFTVGDEGQFSSSGSQAAFLQLDANSKNPQLVFTRFTGGAHCCTNTWVVSKPDGAAGWSLTDAGILDGGGYGFEDVDGDGILEMISVDNSFLYSFDSYAGSFAPVIISKFNSGKVESVSTEPAMQSRLKQDLAGMEFSAKLSPDLWKSNGYLIAWAASKLRLGQGEEAWQTVTENFDRKSEFGPQDCTSGQEIADCPAQNLKAIPTLKAFADFLKENGYGPLPDQAEALLH